MIKNMIRDFFKWLTEVSLVANMLLISNKISMFDYVV